MQNIKYSLPYKEIYFYKNIFFADEIQKKFHHETLFKLHFVRFTANAFFDFYHIIQTYFLLY